MGACGSKDIGRAPARDLSRWEAREDDEGTGNAVDDVPAVEAVAEYPTELALNAVAVVPGASSTGECLTGWEDGGVRRIHWPTRRVLETWTPHSRAVNRLVVGRRYGTARVYACSRDTTVSITNSGSGGNNDGSVETKRSQLLRGHTLNVSTIAVDDDEARLCSGGRDTQTLLWDLATAQITDRNALAQNVITCSAWLPGEAVVVQGSEDLSVKLWDARAGLRGPPAQTLRGFVYFPLGLDVSRDGRHLVTSSKGFNGVGGEARVWDRRTGRQLGQWEGHQQDATACRFLAPSRFATASKDGTVRIWDPTAPGGAHLCEAHEPSGDMFTGLTVVDDNAGGDPERTLLLASTFVGRVHALVYDAHAQTLTSVRRGPAERPDTRRRNAGTLVGIMANALHDCAAYLKQSVHDYERLLGASVEGVWRALMACVERQLRGRRGVSVAPLGKFAIVRDVQPLVLVFHLSERFASAHRVAWKRPPPAPVTPTPELSLSVVGSEAGLPRDQVAKTLEAALEFWGARLRAGEGRGKIRAGSIGAFTLDGRTLSFAFDPGFLKSVATTATTSVVPTMPTAKAAVVLRPSSASSLPRVVSPVAHGQSPPSKTSEESQETTHRQRELEPRRRHRHRHHPGRDRHAKSMGQLERAVDEALRVEPTPAAERRVPSDVLPRFLLPDTATPPPRVNAAALDLAFARSVTELRAEMADRTREDDEIARRTRATHLRCLQEQAERAIAQRDLDAFLSQQIAHKRAQEQRQRAALTAPTDYDAVRILPRDPVVTAAQRQAAKLHLRRRLHAQVALRETLANEDRAVDQAESAYLQAQFRAAAALELEAQRAQQRRTREELLGGWEQQRALRAAQREVLGVVRPMGTRETRTQT